MEVSGLFHAQTSPPAPQGKDASTHWREDWVGPRAALEAVVKRKYPFRESNPLGLTPRLLTLLSVTLAVIPKRNQLTFMYKILWFSWT